MRAINLPTDLLRAFVSVIDLGGYTRAADALGRTQPPRWVSWISPPFEPYAPALVAEGVPAERQLVIEEALALL